MLEPGYGYLRITQFQNETGGEVREKLALQAQSRTARCAGSCSTCAAIPGGLLHAAVEVSDAFLDGGVIVSHARPRAGRRRELQRRDAAT